MKYYEIIYKGHIIPAYNETDLIKLYNDLKNAYLLKDYQLEIVTIKDGMRTSNKKGGVRR